MTYIVMALHAEASFLISYLQLKKIADKPFAIYQNSNSLLILSGIGNLNAAIATTHLLTHYPISPQDRIINIGICGSYYAKDTIGSLFMIRKIIDPYTQKSYLLHSPSNKESKQATLVSFATPQTKKSGKYHLVDMEGVGFYSASKKFCTLEQIYLLKIVHDHLQTKLPTKEEIQKLIEQNLSEITLWL